MDVKRCSSRSIDRSVRAVVLPLQLDLGRDVEIDNDVLIALERRSPASGTRVNKKAMISVVTPAWSWWSADLRPIPGTGVVLVRFLRGPSSMFDIGWLPFQSRARAYKVLHDVVLVSLRLAVTGDKSVFDNTLKRSTKCTRLSE